MKRPNRKEYINKSTKVQLIADLEKYIDYLEEQNQVLTIHSIKKHSELLAFKQFISKTPIAELEYYSDEEFTDLYIKANCV